MGEWTFSSDRDLRPPFEDLRTEVEYDSNIFYFCLSDLKLLPREDLLHGTCVPFTCTGEAGLAAVPDPEPDSQSEVSTAVT